MQYVIRHLVGESRVAIGALDFAQTLYAERTLFHDTHGSCDHVWVELEIERLWPYVGVVIELSDAVWACVRTVTGTYTTVVDHGVEAVEVVIRREYRADTFTWRVTTVLAHHRHEDNFISFVK